MGARPVRKLRDRSGQAMVELAIIMPMLLLLVVGIMELASAFQTHQLVTNVAREGARVSVLRDASDVEVRRVVENRLASSGLDPQAALISFQCDDQDGGLCTGADRSGRKSGVGVAYPHRFVLLGGIAKLATGNREAGGMISLRASTSMMNH